ncbi:boule-related [Schistosoma mansoni]|uniref:boule-related n=1 Tax=Schistosoma mansoni TaxID=6183 RepID=UPI0001A638FB|nr:boule-related [Schistosoma mansoni]|eukprot:XP_018653637.1 boule-related [Schistosoma mansoni]
MSGINIQTGDQTNRLISENALIPICHPLAPGSSSLPKFGTLIPNRIFVGGIPSNTNEQELKSFFSSFGHVKDVKIINDRLGASKGYGFVTFESQEMAEKIIKNESETLIFKDRKLNIGHAIRKQQIFPRPELTTTLLFTGSAIPYSFQNGMAVFPLPGQEYPILTQTTAPYATMILPQPDGGTPLYLPPLHSTPAAAISPYTHIPQHAVTAALHQQFHQTGAVSCLTPAVVGQITPLNVSVNNTNPQSHSTPSVMAAAAAMAAAVQWPQHPGPNNQQNPQQSSAVTVTHSVSHVNNEHSINQTSTITQNQSTVTAQHPTNWHWSPGIQQSQNTIQGTSPQSNMFTIDTSSSISTTKSTSISNPNLQFPQQVSNSTLSLYPSSFGDISSTLQLLQSSTLTASTAALLAATVMQQPNTNIFDNEINMNLDMTTVATLAALATASINSPSLINTNMNSMKEMKKTKEKEDVTTSGFSKSVHLNDDIVGLSFTQPIKKPRYDVETAQKTKKDE